jgi:transposase InsO family protein
MILAIIDRFSKMIRLIPTTMEITALRLAKLYRDNIWKMHGLPRRIMSDRGLQFAAELMKSLCTMLGTKQNLLTVYHPQTDGHVEQSHQETEVFLQHYIDHLQDDWYDWLAIGEFQYNDKIHSSTNHTPFFLNYGRHPWKGEIQTSKGTNPTAEDFVHALEIAREEAAVAMAQAAEKAKSHYDLRRRSARAYKPNDLIWLEVTNLKEVRPSKKLSAKRYGPFKILAKVGESAYRIELPDNWRLLHPIFNESLLTPYTKPAFPSQ